MGLTELWTKVLDLPPTHCEKEIPGKLGRTWMLVNGKLEFVAEADFTWLIIVKANGTNVTLKNKDVTSLDVWIPRTGVYFKKDSSLHVLLTRIAVRQWKKSFCTDFYRVDFPETSFDLRDLDPNSRKEFWVDEKRNVCFMDSKVGFVKNSKMIVCTNPIVHQELIDWIRDS